VYEELLKRVKEREGIKGQEELGTALFSTSFSSDLTPYEQDKVERYAAALSQFASYLFESRRKAALGYLYTGDNLLEKEEIKRMFFHPEISAIQRWIDDSSVPSNRMDEGEKKKPLFKEFEEWTKKKHAIPLIPWSEKRVGDW
jgi:hypothetical protein